MPHKVVAFDLATRTGVAAGFAGGTPRAWSVDLRKTLSENERFSRALRMADAVIKQEQPDIVAVEAPIGGPHTSHFLVGLAACVRGMVELRGITQIQPTIAKVRKHFIGKHLTRRDFSHLKDAAAKKMIKQEVVARCQLLGWSPADDDEADALALWDYTCGQISANHHLTTIGGLFADQSGK